MSDWYSRRSQAVRRLILFLSTLMAVGVALWFIPTPYYITGPGMAFDTSRLISVPGGQVRRGRLMMLAVTVRPANLLLYVYAKLDPRAELETTREFLGDVPDYAHYLQISQAMMDESRETASAIALQEVGVGKGVTSLGLEVTALSPGSPVAGQLQVGDLIVAAGGRPVRATTDLRDALRGLSPGQSVTLRIRRGSAELDLLVPTIAHPAASEQGRAALLIFTRAKLTYDLPLSVSFHSWSITGPSGGLMFTLQVMDQLTPGGITAGRVVAGTGTIEADGRVGPIGGVQQKVYTAEAAGATVMFVPAENYEPARQVARRIEIVRVEHLRDAVRWLQEHRGGGA